MSADRDLEACPSCGSGRIACVLGLTVDRLDFCMQCYRVWEPLPPGEPHTVDGEQLPFRVPCENCAFRGGSAERQQEDGAYWQDLQQMLRSGGQFYCHKGVPFRVVNPDGEPATAPGDRGFEFPRKTATVDLAGETHPYQHYDKERMRLCRGYLNAHVGPLLKKVLDHA
jgi:hypothetical protein